MTDPSGERPGAVPGARPDPLRATRPETRTPFPAGASRPADAANDPSDAVTTNDSGDPRGSPVASFDVEFAALERRLDRLTGLCERLALENRSLRGQQRALVEERARLVEKNETARTKVEQMIVRLKSLEAGQ